MIKKVILIALTCVMAFTVASALPDTAQAGVNCVKRDHYHDNRYVKHDRRYKFRQGSSMYVRWDVKLRQPSGYYKKYRRINAYCYDVDIAMNPLDRLTDLLEPSNLLTDPKMVMV